MRSYAGVAHGAVGLRPACGTHPLGALRGGGGGAGWALAARREGVLVIESIVVGVLVEPFV